MLEPDAGVGSGEAPTEGLASARRTNCSCRFPASSFHDDAPWRAAMEGIKPTRFTSRSSP
jgi:hypothetical protein